MDQESSRDVDHRAREAGLGNTGSVALVVTKTMTDHSSKVLQFILFCDSENRSRYMKKFKAKAYAPHLGEVAWHYENKIGFGIKTWVLVVLSLIYQLYDLRQINHHMLTYKTGIMLLTLQIVL